jgi:RNA polymerase sigma-70 factor (ECF subfamily)
VIAAATQPALADGLDLVRRHQAGDPDAFTEIYRKHYPAILAFANNRVRNLPLAEDIAQETFTKAFAKLGTHFEVRDKAIVAWLITIARNLCVDYFKRAEHRRRKWSLDAMHDDSADVVLKTMAPAADELVLAALESADLASALLDLTPHQQNVIILRFFCGMSVAETCREMGLLEGAVKTLTRRAVQGLARRMDLEDWR